MSVKKTTTCKCNNWKLVIQYAKSEHGQKLHCKDRPTPDFILHLGQNITEEVWLLHNHAS